MWHRAAHAVLVGSLLVLPLAAGEVQEITTDLGFGGGPMLATSQNWFAVGRAKGVNLYERRDGAWAFMQHLDNPQIGPSGSFGYAVAMDDEWLAVSAQTQDVAGVLAAGAVYVYRREGNLWLRTQKLAAPVAHLAEFFGAALTIEDGYLFVRNHPIFATARPSLWAYRLAGSQWQLVQEIEVHFGGSDKSVDFQSPWLIVGEPYVSPRPVEQPYSRAGRVRFFELTSDGFELRQTVHGTTQSFLGASVALDGDGALIGAPGFRAHATGHNRAHVLRLDGTGTWVHEQTLEPDVVGEDSHSDRFGHRLDLRGDRAVVGASWFDFEGDLGGAVFVYERSGGVWTLAEHLRPGDQATGDELGDSVLFAVDSILVSAPWHVHDGVIGCVYSFEF